MKTEIGEYVVGAYFNFIEDCGAVVYNVRPRSGKIQGLGKLDVIGYRFSDKSIFMCEASTYLNGVYKLEITL